MGVARVLNDQPGSPRAAIRPLPFEDRPQIISDDRRSWTYLAASARTINCATATRTDLSSNKPRLVVLLEGVGGRMVVNIDGVTDSVDAEHRTRHMSVIPAGGSAWRDLKDVILIRDLTLDFEPEKVAEAFGRATDAEAVFAPRTVFFNERLFDICRLLAAECQSPHEAGALYADSLSLALLVGLGRLGQSQTQTTRRGGLAHWKRQRATDYIEANLTAGVDLAALASLTRLSASHFVRAFKESLGVTPHQWLRNARIERAKQLIATMRTPLAQVALQTGFSDQAHLTRIFRQVTGECPGAWRRGRIQRDPAGRALHQEAPAAAAALAR
jgi:AraC family transcriptional regulator